MSFLSDLGGAFTGGLTSFVGGLGDMAFNAWSAEKQEDFQAKMASTQYQRAAIDLEKAGLNRVLALGSPAASPAGALAPPAQFAAQSQAATAAKVAAAQVENLKADTMKKVEEGQYIDQQRQTSASQQILNSALAAWHVGNTGNLPLVADEIRARIGNLGASSAKTRAEIPLVKMQTVQAGELSRRTGAEADQAEVLKAGYQLLLPIIESLMRRFESSAKGAESGYQSILRDFFKR